MVNDNKLIRDFLENINNKRKNFGEYKKTLFHIHTPASYDYKVLEKNEEGNKINDDELIEIMKNLEFSPCLYDKKYLKNLNIEEKYASLNEYYVYLLIAKKLLNSEIEIALITDHNTIEGYRKLQFAIKSLYDLNRSQKFCNLFLGVEISCADKNHIVGIFGNRNHDAIEVNAKRYDEIKNWLDKCMVNLKDGTYFTSIQILEEIKNLGGIGYLAHANTSNMFSEDENKFMSIGYKKRLIQDENLKILGLKDTNKKDYIERQLVPYNKSFCYVLDEDLHSIEKIGSKYFWIKASKINFNSIKSAFNDYKISIELEKPTVPTTYIKGMMVVPWENKGFLMKNNYEPLILNFSDSLTCIIGGRGTGKSTVLKLLNFVLSQKCENSTELEFFCKNKYVYILVSHNHNDYLVKFASPKKDYEDEEILKYFSDDRIKNFNYNKNYDFDHQLIEEYMLRHYIKIKRIEYKEDRIKFTPEKNEILSHFFNRQYTINELVEKSKSEQITEYIYQELFGIKRKQKKKINLVRSKAELLKTFNNRGNEVISQLTDKKEIIDNFNSKNGDLLNLVYYIKDDIKFNYEKILGINSNNKFFFGYNISNKNVLEYLYYLERKENNGINVIKKFLDYDNSVFDLNDIKIFCENSKRVINNGLKIIDDETLKTDFITKIKKLLFSKEGLDEIIYQLNSQAYEEVFDLQFNLNSNEIDNKKPIYKSIKELSLGQRVVSLLDFILAAGEFNDDLRPMVLDQPEDNLDNRYIYENLVSQLKNVKSKRQVIIATHNSTIVTNAKAELVVIMESDNEKAWIKKVGYPTELRIVKEIVSNLEGGIKSFNHKVITYKSIINEKDY